MRNPDSTLARIVAGRSARPGVAIAQVVEQSLVERPLRLAAEHPIEDSHCRSSVTAGRATGRLSALAG
jgi:hypothetical protein